MFALSANRATIAGLGSTAALLAAVVAVSLLVGGLVAYSGSTAGPLIAGEPRLALPQRAADATRQASVSRAPLVLPAATAVTPVGALAASGAAAPGARATDSSSSAPVTSTTTAPGDTVPAPVDASTDATPTRTPSPLVVPGAPALPMPSAGLAGTTATTGQALGGTLRDTITAVGAFVSKVLPPLGQPVDDLGVVLGGTVTQTTDGLAEVLRRLGG